MNKHGISGIIVVITLLIIAVSTIGILYIAGQQQIETVERAEEVIEAEEVGAKSSILIEEVLDDDVIVRNNGFTNIPTDVFIVFSNSSKTRPGQNPTILTIDQINDTGALIPGGVINITVCASLPLLGEALITVDVSEKIRDEVLTGVDIPVCS